MLSQNAISEFDNATLQPEDSLLPCPAAVRINSLDATAIVIAQSKADADRYLLTWFDRHFWIVRRKWMHRNCFTPLTFKLESMPIEEPAEDDFVERLMWEANTGAWFAAKYDLRTGEPQTYVRYSVTARALAYAELHDRG